MPRAGQDLRGHHGTSVALHHWQVVPLMIPLQQLFELPQLFPPRGTQPPMAQRHVPPVPQNSDGVVLEQQTVFTLHAPPKSEQGFEAVTVVPASP